MGSKEELLNLLGIKPEEKGDGPSLLLPNKAWRAAVNTDVGSSCFNLDQWELEQGNRLTTDNEVMEDIKMADCFAAAFRQYPEMENQCTDQKFQQFMSTLIESPDFNVLHQSTMSNLMASDMAAIEFSKQYQQIAGKEEPTEIDQIRAANKALKKAQKEVDAFEQMALAFGIGPSTGGESDMKRIRDNFNAVKNNAQLKRIIELAGRYRLSAQSQQRNKVKHGYDDMVGVKLDGDVGKLLPVEMAKMSDPMMRLDAMRRLIERQSMCRDYEGLEPQDRGPVIICVDESGSMRGEPIANAKALALAMYWIARHQKREMILMSFHCGREYHGCIIRQKGKPGKELTDWLSHFFGGGTDLVVPLLEVPELWNRTKFVHGKADMIIITDAQLHVGDDMRDVFLKWKKKEQVRVQTIVIGAGGESVKEVSDIVHNVSRLSVDSDPVNEAFSI